jgi:hypothetical protein
MMTYGEELKLRKEFEALELRHIYERNAFCSCGESVKSIQGHAVHKSYLLLELVRGVLAAQKA